MRESRNRGPSTHAQMLDLCLNGAVLASRRLTTAQLLETADGEYAAHLTDELAELDRAIMLWEDKMLG